MDSNSNLGFTLVKRKSMIYSAEHITDIGYAEDIAVITNSMIDANTLLHKIEDTAKDIGLHINSDTTELLYINHENMKILSGHYIKRVEEFKYLGS